ncbi:hypothetical protein Hanom_Chr15g01353041 [Helianthus anomalus]
MFDESGSDFDENGYLFVDQVLNGLSTLTGVDDVCDDNSIIKGGPVMNTDGHAAAMCCDAPFLDGTTILPTSMECSNFVDNIMEGLIFKLVNMSVPNPTHSQIQEYNIIIATKVGCVSNNIDSRLYGNQLVEKYTHGSGYHNISSGE